MRMPNDVLLAEGTQGVIDLVLGGHDHSYETKQVGDVFVCKSGTDFREFTEITVNFDNGKLNVDTCKHKITSDIPEDEVVKAALKKFQDKIESQMEEVLDVIDFQFEGRFSELRTGETNLGNLIVDVMRQVTHADVAIINSGTMRSDTMHGPGQIKMKDLSTILPMLDTITVLQVTGSQLMAALENGVSQYPKHEGRFPQVSGLKFCFDPDCEAYHRIVKDSVVVGNEPLQENKTYKLCTKGYLAAGKDGYEILQQAGVLLSEHDGPLLPIIIQNHFNSVAVQRGVKKSSSKHIQNPSL
jgi:5'-nucleotidase